MKRQKEALIKLNIDFQMELKKVIVNIQKKTLIQIKILEAVSVL